MSAAAAVLATALVFSPVDATPPPTYFLGGTDLTGTATVTTADIDWLLAGELTGAQNVPYPRGVTGMDASVGVGADAIIDILGDIPDNTAGPVRIAGVSQGALAIAEAKRRIMALDELIGPLPTTLCSWPSVIPVAPPGSVAGCPASTFPTSG